MNLITFDKKCICGPEFVCVRIIENCDNLKVGDIYLPNTTMLNSRLAHCIVEDVGWKSAEEYGLNVGDYVLIDRLSTFAHTAPVALLKYNNIIVKTDANRSEFFPLKNMIFVQPDTKPTATNLDGILVPSSYDEKLKTGKILKLNVDKNLKTPFKVGDKVMLSNSGDIIDLGNVKLHIYKHDDLICSINED